MAADRNCTADRRDLAEVAGPSVRVLQKPAGISVLRASQNALSIGIDSLVETASSSASGLLCSGLQRVPLYRIFRCEPTAVVAAPSSFPQKPAACRQNRYSWSAATPLRTKASYPPNKNR